MLPLQQQIMKSLIACHNSKIHNTLFYKLFDSKLGSFFDGHKTQFYPMNYRERFSLGDKYIGLFTWNYNMDTWTESTRILIKQRNIPSYFEENLDITNNIYDHTLYQCYRTNDSIIKSYYNVNELPQDIFTLQKLK